MNGDKPRCLARAIYWVRRGVGVVPLKDEGPGRLVPAIRWEQDGPLRDEESVVRWYTAHPEHGLAITLENPATHLLLIDDDSGKHPVPEDKPRPRAIPGYRESSRSKGAHGIAVIKTLPPPDVPRHLISLGGYVDLMLAGIVFVAPTENKGVGEYTIIDGRDPPVFESVLLALQAAEPVGRPWLVSAWREARSGSTGGGTGTFQRIDRPVPKDIEELLARMADGSPAGAVAAWIAKNTNGHSRPPFLCFHLGSHAWAVGGSPEQVRAVVNCDHAEWHEGYESLVRRFQRRPPAGLATLRKFAEGRAAYEELSKATPKEITEPVVRTVIGRELADWIRWKNGGRRG